MILNYECENGHKWKSKEWPTSTWFAIKVRREATYCPVCGSTITKCQSEDGKQGAMHIGFKNKNAI